MRIDLRREDVECARDEAQRAVGMRARTATRYLGVELRDAIELVILGAAALRDRFEGVRERSEPEDAWTALPCALAGHVARHARGLGEAAYRTREGDDRPGARRSASRT